MTTSRRRRTATCIALCVVLVSVTAATDTQDERRTEPEVLQRGGELGAPVTPRVFDGDVRDLPERPWWKPGDPIRAVPQRFYPRPGEAPPRSFAIAKDPLLDRQRGHSSDAFSGSTQFAVPTRSFDGIPFTGAVPPDTVGDVGPSHFIQAVNSSQSMPPFSSTAKIRIFDKTLPQPNVLATFDMDSLGAGACQGLSDPIVLYDRPADRWLLAEMASTGASFCVYLSKTSDPVSGGWYLYEFSTPSLPDYPKLGVWATDANGGAGSYVVVTNEEDPSGIYALDRGQMLLGAAATSQRFTVARLPSFEIPAPADPNGATPPPTGAAAIFMRQRDTEINNGPAAPGDVLEMWLLDIDWNDPGNSTLTAAPSIDVADFDSGLCAIFAGCFEQPGGAPPLQPLNWFVMHRLQYMNHGSYESLLGNFTVDVDGLDHGGVRWFELRSAGGGPWSLYQEGTYSLDTPNRWMGAIASDQTGNVALGFNVVSPSVFPDLRYTGRRSFDPLGVMTQPETVLAPGTDSENTERYGDYAAMSVDPVDDCTFWFTGEYSTTGQWATRIATFSFENCPCVTSPSAPAVQLAVPGDNRIDVSWDDSTSSSAVEYLVRRSRVPGGPYTTIATVADSSPGAGGGPGYFFQDTDVSGGTTYYYIVTVLDTVSCPSDPSIEAGATGTGACLLRPTFTGLTAATSGAATCAIDLGWSAAVAFCGGPVTYDVYRSTTPGFVPSAANLVASGIATTSASDANGLVEGTDYYYIVRAIDLSVGLDDGNTSYRGATATGITPAGFQTLFEEDFETPGVIGTTWTVGTGPGAHQCGEWERVDDPANLPNGGSGFYARALSQGCAATSTFLDSPVIDLSGPEIQSATLFNDLRFSVDFMQETATVEAWNGTAWEVVSPNASSVNGFFFFDVSAQAVGNAQFQVRYNYQDAVNDTFFAVDDVSIGADIVFGAECTSSTGVSPVPDGSDATTPLTATRVDPAGSQIDVQFDAASCPSSAYNLLYGSLSQVAASTIDGSACGIGAGSFSWTSVPAGDLFFLVVGFDGGDVESRWGDATTGERSGLTASDECGATLKNITLTCP